MLARSSKIVSDKHSLHAYRRERSAEQRPRGPARDTYWPSFSDNLVVVCREGAVPAVWGPGRLFRANRKAAPHEPSSSAAMPSDGGEKPGDQAEGMDEFLRDCFLIERRSASISSASSCASLVYSVEFTSPEILEPVLDNVAVFLAHYTIPSDERTRVTWRWIGMFTGTCKTIHAGRNALMLFVVEFAGQIGDAKGVSCMLGHRGLEISVYEAGVAALLRMMPEIDKAIHHEDLDAHLHSLDLLDSVEDECLRIASWENGVVAVVAVMTPCATKAVQEQGRNSQKAAS